MKKTVLTMAQEDYDFSHNVGKLVFDAEKVEMEFTTPEVREGAFSIESENGLPVDGFVYANESRMRIKESSFHGVDCEICYSFDATGLEPGDKVSGQFIILSDKGEYTLDFEASMEADYMYSSMGQIKNLFHFTNLARTNWPEAVSLYYSNRFAEILTGNDKQYRSVYRGLSHEPGNEHCVDEFLITVHKKTRNSYELPTNHYVFRAIPDKLEKSTFLTVNGWGYVSVDVEPEGDFIRLNKTSYCGNDIVDGHIEIEYELDPEMMHAGRNFGKLILTTPEQVFEVAVIVECNPIDMERSANHIYKKTVARLMREYIAFRLGKLTSEEWVLVSSEELSHLTVKGEREVLVRLYEIQLLITARREEEAQAHMEKLEEELKDPEKALGSSSYGYYLYLTTMLHPESDYVDKVAHKVKKLYHKNSYDPVLAWIQIYLREDLAFRDEKRWDYLEEQFHSGIDSPLLFTEAVHLLDKQPSLLTKLSEYELTLLSFALKNGAITSAIGERVQFLISREKDYDEVLFGVLKKAYQLNPTKDLLQAICQLLMLGDCVGEEYLRWYEDAVKAEIRIAKLYEYYMACVPANYKEMLPQMVMMYFAYQNHLEYDKMALLYANVNDYRALVPEVASSYDETVLDFLKEQIKKGRVNKNLIKLYKKYITPEIMDDELASSFAPILFAHEVRVTRPNIRRVIVVHDKAVGEGKFPVHDGVAYPTIYARNYCILFEDENGRRYVSEALTKPSPVLYTERMRDTVLPLVKGRVGILLNITENDVHDAAVSDENCEYYETLLTSDSVTFTLKKEILYNLCKFYFENDRIRELDRLLMMAKPEVLPASDRGEMVHILVARGLYEDAFHWLCNFGMEHVAAKTCLRLLSRYLERTDYEEDPDMIALCEELYLGGRFDSVILKYLAVHFKGTNTQMLELLRLCESFGCDVFGLIERILVQMLYTRTAGPEREQIYERFVRLNGSTSLRKSYLAECAYGYFVGEYKVPESVFGEMERLHKDGEKLSRICKLSYALYYSTKGSASWNIPLLREIITKEIKSGVVFPYFLKFASEVPAVVPFTDRSFVEYRGNGNSRVIMHYAIERENSDNAEYRKEEMDNLYYGIFVKDFILFSGDVVNYYITEESGNQEQLTLSATLTGADNSSCDVPWRYHVLNEAVMLREKAQEQRSAEVLEEYAHLEYITKKLFHAE